MRSAGPFQPAKPTLVHATCCRCSDETGGHVGAADAFVVSDGSLRASGQGLGLGLPGSGAGHRCAHLACAPSPPNPGSTTASVSASGAAHGQLTIVPARRACARVRSGGGATVIVAVLSSSEAVSMLTCAPTASPHKARPMHTVSLPAGPAVLARPMRARGTAYPLRVGTDTGEWWLGSSV